MIALFKGNQYVKNNYMLNNLIENIEDVAWKIKNNGLLGILVYNLSIKKNRYNFLLIVSAGTINIGLNYWLIPIFGYVVAAYTTLVSYFLIFIFYF